MKLYVIRGKERIRPARRINMLSRFCSGAQWQTAFGTRGRTRELQFGGSNCLRNKTVAKQIKFYFEYLKARGRLEDWVAEQHGAEPTSPALPQARTSAVEQETQNAPEAR